MVIIIITLLLTAVTPHGQALSASSGSPTVLTVGDEGREVLLLQTRLSDLGYFIFRATGVFGAVTRNSVVALQSSNRIMSDGTVGEETYRLIFQNGVRRKSVPDELKQEKGIRNPVVSVGAAEAVEWDDVLNGFFGASNVLITDFYTGIEFYVTLTSINNGHLEAECVSEGDFQKYKDTFGGSVSWEKRPVTVKFASYTSAASIFGMPHGFDNSPTNAMTGHCCLYFRGSSLNSINDTEHESNIDIAAGI